MDAFSPILAFVLAHGYLIIFLLMVIEGPIVNSAASFAASLGYFNIFLVYLFAFLGDLTGDLLFYAIGHFGHKHIISKYGKYVGLSKKRVAMVHNVLHKNSIKSIIAIKFTPLLAGVGLAVVGASPIKFRKFLLVSILTIIPTSLFFTLSGYFTGLAFVQIKKYFDFATTLIAAILILIIVLPIIYRKIAKILSEKIKNSK